MEENLLLGRVEGHLLLGLLRFGPDDKYLLLGRMEGHLLFEFVLHLQGRLRVSVLLPHAINLKLAVVSRLVETGHDPVYVYHIEQLGVLPQQQKLCVL